MSDEPTKHHRRSIRLRGYDYTEHGAYFVTVCTHDRACLFGHTVDGAMHLNDAGRLIETAWTDLPHRFPDIGLDVFVVMPNHFHGIVLIAENVGAAPVVGAPVANARGPVTGVEKGTTTRVAPTLGKVIGAFKSLSTVAYIRGVDAKRWPAFRTRLWQRNYYEHVIRDEADLSRVRRYVDENPMSWELDDENPQRIRPCSGAAASRGG